MPTYRQRVRQHQKRIERLQDRIDDVREKMVEAQEKNLDWLYNDLGYSTVEVKIEQVENKLKSNELKLDLFDRIDFYKKLNESQLQNIQPKGNWKSIYDSPSMDSAIRAMTNDAKNAQKLKEHQEVVNHIEEMKKMEAEPLPKFQTTQTPDYRSPAMIVVREPEKKLNIFVRFYRRYFEKFKPVPKTDWKLKTFKTIGINQTKSVIDPNLVLHQDNYDYVVLSRMVGWPWNQTEETKEYYTQHNVLKFFSYKHAWKDPEGFDSNSQMSLIINQLINEYFNAKEKEKDMETFKKIKNAQSI